MGIMLYLPTSWLFDSVTVIKLNCHSAPPPPALRATSSPRKARVGVNGSIRRALTMPKALVSCDPAWAIGAVALPVNSSISGQRLPRDSDSRGPFRVFGDKKWQT